MIGYLEGRILNFEQDGILLLVNNTGYEILLNPQMLEEIKANKNTTENTCLYIYHHQTERQPKPVLIGFNTLEDKEFFQTFITVDAIGPMKAVKAMSCSAGQVALAIEKKDVSFLTGLSGIGKRTAEKIIATLNGKMEKFIPISADIQEESTETIPVDMMNISQQVVDVLIEQLGHSQASAKRLVSEAFERNNMISSPEELFDEIYQENR